VEDIEGTDETEGTSDRRKLLERWMNDRRRELRIKWTEVARRSEMSVQNVLRIRKGQISISEDAADGIETALEWEPGSVERAVREGIKPTPASPPAPAVEPPAVRVEEADRLVEAIRGVLDLRGKKMTPRMVKVFLDEIGAQIMPKRPPEDR
jgi:hypothetical protein